MTDESHSSLSDGGVEREIEQAEIEWAIERATSMCASALLDAQVYGKRLLKGFGYPNETFGRAQDHQALRIVLTLLSTRGAALAEMQREVCICAAIRLSDGRIFRGHRHHNCFAVLADLRTVDASIQSSIVGIEQGFVTSRNRFVNRAEGYRLQLAAGIGSASRDGYRGGQLFSEDLY
jgi:hypothetical protein